MRKCAYWWAEIFLKIYNDQCGLESVSRHSFIGVAILDVGKWKSRGAVSSCGCCDNHPTSTNSSPSREPCANSVYSSSLAS